MHMKVNDKKLKGLVKEATNRVLNEFQDYVKMQPHSYDAMYTDGTPAGRATEYNPTRNYMLEQILDEHFEKIVQEWDEFILGQERGIPNDDYDEQCFQSDFSGEQEGHLTGLLEQAKEMIMDGMIKWIKDMRKSGRSNSRLNEMAAPRKILRIFTKKPNREFKNELERCEYAVSSVKYVVDDDAYYVKLYPADDYEEEKMMINMVRKIANNWGADIEEVE